MMPRLKLFVCSAAVLAAVVFAGARGVLLCESAAPEANIRTRGDALWWALNVCSVGDASLHPVTTGGRLVGAALIIVGYGCFAVNVGLISSVVSALVRGAEGKLR